MSDKKNQKKPNKKSGLKCKSCEFYDRDTDFCTERSIKKCSKQANVNFSKCEDYLVRENLVMY